jgi:hypothetical protein
MVPAGEPGHGEASPRTVAAMTGPAPKTSVVLVPGAAGRGGQLLAGLAPAGIPGGGCRPAARRRARSAPGNSARWPDLAAEPGGLACGDLIWHPCTSTPPEPAGTTTSPPSPRCRPSRTSYHPSPTTWDPTGGYFFRDLPFLALWELKYYPFWHLFAPGDTDVLGIPVNTLPCLETVAQGLAAQCQFRRPRR